MPSIVPDNSETGAVHVSVGVVRDRQNHILITRRPDHVHQGGLWEFPGGKINHGETVLDCLQRELDEEVGIQVQEVQALIQIPYRYPDKYVVLHVLEVTKYSGKPRGREGQSMQWIRPEALSSIDFPAANQAIIAALRLPDSYLITGEADTQDDFLQRLSIALKQGIRLVQIRCKTLSKSQLAELTSRAREYCDYYRAILLVNAQPDIVSTLPVNGIHLSSQNLMLLRERPGEFDWVAASVHDKTQLAHAQAIGLDFVVLSPIKATRSHPGAIPLGWSGFEKLASMAQIPVYALGGMQPEDIPQARQSGAQGIAAIQSLWG